MPYAWGTRIRALINTFLGKVFGTKNDREVKRLMPTVQKINALEAEIQKLSDEQLRAKTDEFRRRIAESTKHVTDEANSIDETSVDDADVSRAKSLEDEKRRIENEILDEILPEAFA